MISWEESIKAIFRTILPNFLLYQKMFKPSKYLAYHLHKCKYCREQYEEIILDAILKDFKTVFMASHDD